MTLNDYKSRLDQVDDGTEGGDVISWRVTVSCCKVVCLDVSLAPVCPSIIMIDFAVLSLRYEESGT